LPNRRSTSDELEPDTDGTPSNQIANKSTLYWRLYIPAKGAKLDVTVEARDRDHANEMMRALADAGYQPVRLPAGASID
jgi:hypothetical protein